MITRLSRAMAWLREGLGELRAALADTFSGVPGKLAGAWAWLCFREPAAASTQPGPLALTAAPARPALTAAPATYVPAALDPLTVANGLSVIWSDDVGAYASGQLDASEVHCALCMCAPCRCPEFGTPEYMALVDFRHGRNGSTR